MHVIYIILLTHAPLLLFDIRVYLNLECPYNDIPIMTYPAHYLADTIHDITIVMPLSKKCMHQLYY